MEGESSADRRGGRYHVILCVVIGEMTLSTCLLCRLFTQDENQSANLLALMRELCFRSGTMSTVLAGSRRLSLSLAMLLAVAVWPLGRWKILLDSSSVA